MQGVATRTCWACGAQATPSIDPSLDGLWQCQHCGLRFQPDRSSAAVRELYDAEYFEEYVGGAYDEDPAARAYEAKRRVHYLRRHARAGDLLEVGVAGGWFLDAARANGFKVRGIEPAEAMAESARRRFGLDIETAFVEDADLAEESLDVVCAWHVIEHVPEPLETLRGILRSLRPGGILAFEVPNAGSDHAAEQGLAWHGWQFDVHLGHYTPAAAVALLERAGYTGVEVETIHGSDYHRPSVALKPGNVAGAAKRALTGGGLAYRPHPSKKEMLRAAGRRPE